FDVNRHTLTADFYKRLEDLKVEHGKTMELLSQLYTNRKNNSMIHENSDQENGLLIPGYKAKEVRFRQEMREKEDREKSNSDLSSSEENEGDHMNDHADDVVHSMWEQFSLHDYMRKNRDNLRPAKSKEKARPKSAPAKKTEWSPVITIPKPFNMTIREEQKKEKDHTRNCSSSMEVSLREREKEENIEREMSMRVRAREPPAHIYLPLYDEIVERREQRQRFNKENSIATLMALQKPFTFAERDEKKKQEQFEAEKKKLRKIKKLAMFEASGVPYSVHDVSVSERLKEEELYRKIKIKMRSEDTYRKSALPPRMQAHEMMALQRRSKWQEDVDQQTACSFQPKTHEMPDFDALHKREEIEAFNRKMEVETTSVKPFNLRTDVRSKKKDEEFDPQKSLTEPKWSTPRFKATKPLVQSEINDQNSEHVHTIPARMTDSTRRRLELMKQSLQQAERDLEFLEDVKNRVNERPLLFEQHNQKMAKAQAEKRYREILETSGISDDFV
uniref:FAM161 centrosomal protein A n=1 Tax=Ciona intestinalis TaxID=7719 RepID=H2XQP9_CIOIN